MDPKLLILIINGAIAALDAAMKIADNLKQDKELTPTQEKALDKAIAELSDKPWWQKND